MYQLILFLHVLICVAIIALVLVQHGKGADIGASFGSGASNTVFGRQGSGAFLVKLTGFLAAAFFIACLLLGSLATYSVRKQSLNIPKTEVPVNKSDESSEKTPSDI